VIWLLIVSALPWQAAGQGCTFG